MDSREKIFAGMMEVIDVSYDLMNQYDKRSHLYDEHLLYQNESYMIRHIGENPGITITELSKIENKSKSACSMILKKLISKNLAYQERNMQNLREYFINLTDRGEKVYSAHVHLNETYINRTFEMLNMFTNEELETFVNIQRKINESYLLDNQDDIEIIESKKNI